MRVEQIHAFVVSADMGSFTKAGRQLGLHRSSVSAAVQALEDELGVVLFERSGNALQLSPAGAGILSDCQRLLANATAIQQRANQLSQGTELTLKIARDDAIPEPIWHAALLDVQNQFPTTSLEVYLATAQEHAALLHAQSVDIAFGLAQPGLSGRAIARLANVLVVAPSHPLVGLKQVASEDLLQYRQICLAYMADGQLHQSVSPGLREAQIEGVTGSYTAMTSYELIRDAVIAGHGWGILPSVLTKKALQQGLLVQLKPTVELEKAVFQCVHRQQPGQVARWLEAHLQNALTQP